VFTRRVEPFGCVVVPDVIAESIRPEQPWRVLCAGEKPSHIAELLRDGAVIILTGPYRLVEGVWRYLQHHPQILERDGAAGQGRLSRRRRQRRRTRVQEELSRLAVVVRGTELVGVEDAPELMPPADWLTDGAARWHDVPILLPVTWLQRILRQIRRSREGMVVRALEASLIVLPHVYTPTDQSVVDLLAEHLELPAGEPLVLDMGCGCGVLGLIAARRGARVVATDVNPWAVRNTRLNAQRLGLADRLDVRGPGDLFEPLGPERFDAVLFNPPWIPARPATRYDWGLCDPGYETIDRFLRAVGGHLRPGGRVWLFWSDFAEALGARPLDHLHEQIVSGGLRVETCWSRSRRSRKTARRETIFLFVLREDTT